DLTLILLKGRDLLRIRGPDEDRPIAFRPTGVVGGVAEILDAVGRQLRFLASRHVAHPQVPVADERHALTVRRPRLGPWRSAGAAAAASLAHGLRAGRHRARGARGGD